MKSNIVHFSTLLNPKSVNMTIEVDGKMVNFTEIQYYEEKTALLEKKLKSEMTREQMQQMLEQINKQIMA